MLHLSVNESVVSLSTANTGPSQLQPNLQCQLCLPLGMDR